MWSGARAEVEMQSLCRPRVSRELGLNAARRAGKAGGKIPAPVRKRETVVPETEPGIPSSGSPVRRVKREYDCGGSPPPTEVMGNLDLDGVLALQAAGVGGFNSDGVGASTAFAGALCAQLEAVVLRDHPIG